MPADVLAFAARLLPLIAPALAPPTSVRRTRGDLAVRTVRDTRAAAVDAVRRAGAREGSIGLIVADADARAHGAALRGAGIDFVPLGDERDVDARVDLVPASLAKGLEFDHVVVCEPARIVAGEADQLTGLRRLYVCLTRAVTSLTVLHADALPGALLR